MKPQEGGICIFRPDRVLTFRRFDVLTFILLLLLTACKAKPKPNSETPPPPAPSFAALAATHNDRIERLNKFYTNGVIEIRWTDRKGKHFEQGNLETWIVQPRRTALRVEKLGEPLLWLGSNDSQYWLFDLLGDDRILYLGRHDESMTSGFETGEMTVNRGDLIINLKPLALLDLMGITPLEQTTSSAVEYNRTHDAWVVCAAGRGGPMRIYFERQSLLPKRVESLTTTNQVAASSMLQRYKSVTLPGVSPIAFPKLPHLIDIRGEDPAAGAEAPSRGEVKIAIDNSTTVIEEAQLQGVFDLERLKQALRPGRVEEM